MVMWAVIPPARRAGNDLCEVGRHELKNHGEADDAGLPLERQAQQRQGVGPEALDANFVTGRPEAARQVPEAQVVLVLKTDQ